jgi:hypothetical protein
MSQYTASTPGDDQVRPEIKGFFEKFYEISDTPSDHELYAKQFTKNGRLIMGPNESNGRDGKPTLVEARVRFCVPDITQLGGFIREIALLTSCRDC